MKDRLQEWLHEHPRARPVIMFGLLGLFCLFTGIWLTARGSRPIENINVTPIAGSEQVPTLTSGDNSPARPKSAWISHAGTPLRSEPDLKLGAIRTLPEWEEVFWLHEDEGWDQVRLADATEGWVQNKDLVFAKPANLDKPNGAEEAVMTFYKAVALKDYVQAYNYLSGDWRNDLNFNSFVEGYAQTNNLRTEISQVIPMGTDRFQVDVSMVADEGGRNVEYIGTYLVQKKGNDWCLDSGSLTRKPGAAPPAEAPRDVVVSPAAPEELPDTLGSETATPEGNVEAPGPADETAAPPEATPAEAAVSVTPPPADDATP